MFKNIYHYILIRRSGLFDENYYLATSPEIATKSINPLMHFIKVGWKEGRNPSKAFDTQYYLRQNADVKLKDINPLIHFIKHGKYEGRSPHPGKETQPNRLLHNTQKKQPEAPRNEQPTAIGKGREPEVISTPTSTSNSPENVTVYAHIGQSKTGTSLIQNFLDVNRNKLMAEHGYLYPNFFARDLTSGSCHNLHHWFIRSLEDGNIFTQDLDRLDDFLAKHALDRVIFSNEGWELHEQTLAFFQKLLKIKPHYNLKAIMYVRRIDTYIESAWKQWGLKNHENIEDFYNLHYNLNRFQFTFNHLEKLAQLFGTENIIVRPYEKKQLPNGLLHDFMTTIGIDLESTKWNHTENINIATNRGFNREVLEILHYCRDLFDNVHDNHLYDLFDELLGEKFQKAPFESYALLAPEQRLELINTSMPYEKRIAKIFMGRPDGKLFHEPLPNLDEPYEPYQGLTIKKAIPIIVRMLDENNRQLKEMQQQLELIKNNKQ